MRPGSKKSPLAKEQIDYLRINCGNISKKDVNFAISVLKEIFSNYSLY